MDEISANDARQLTRARRGDEAAFLELYQRYRRPVFQFAWRLTGSESAAEDVAQESFLALLEGAGYDPAQGALKTYLLGIARHRAMRQLRAAEREAEEPAGNESPSDAPDALCSLLRAERAALVARAVASLPFAQREALVLFEYEDLSLEEIAQIMGCEPGAVKARLFRARDALRKRLGPLLAVASARGSS